MVTLPGNGKVSAGPGWMTAGVYNGHVVNYRKIPIKGGGLCWDTTSPSEPPSLNHLQDLNRSRSQPQDHRGCSGGMLREEMTQEIPVPNLAPQRP